MQYYKVIHDGAVSIYKKVGETRNPTNNEVIGFEHESITYLPDQVIAETEISPVVITQYQSEDPHLRSLIVLCDKKGNPLDEMPKVEEPEAEVEHPNENVTTKGTIRSGAATAKLGGGTTTASENVVESGMSGGMKGPAKK